MWLRRVPLLIVLVVTPLPADAQKHVLPPVGVVLTLEVRDQSAWFEMQHEVLSTPPELEKALFITIPARTGGSRTIAILTPKFSLTLSSATGTASVRVIIKGRIGGDHAQQMLLPFVHAFLEPPAGSDFSKVTLEYGLSALTANLVELKVVDR